MLKLTSGKKDNKNKLSDLDFIREIEEKLEIIMSSYKFCGYAKFVKWAIMGHVSELSLREGNKDDEFLESESRKYVDGLYNN